MLKFRIDGLTYQEIAEKASVSRQRVHQLLSPPAAIRDFVVKKYSGYCMDCGIKVGKAGHVHHNNLSDEEDYSDIDNLQLLCPTCHRHRHKVTPLQRQKLIIRNLDKNK